MSGVPARSEVRRIWDKRSESIREVVERVYFRREGESAMTRRGDTTGESGVRAARYEHGWRTSAIVMKPFATIADAVDPSCPASFSRAFLGRRPSRAL